MDMQKQNGIFAQYIDQYTPVISNTLSSLRDCKTLHIPRAQFLFSIIDYFSLLYVAAVHGRNRKFDKKTPQNFKDFFASNYFPAEVRCKAEFIYFVRNGLIHQIYAKGCSIGTGPNKSLFFPDAGNGGILALDLNYLEKITVEAITNFTNDLKTNAQYIDNLHDVLITDHYGFDDHAELNKIIGNSMNGDINNVFADCK